MSAANATAAIFAAPVAEHDPAVPVLARRRRRPTTPAEREQLEAFYATNPRPSASERAGIAAALDWPEKNVMVWFQNRRQKDKAGISGHASRAASHVSSASAATATPATPAPHVVPPPPRSAIAALPFPPARARATTPPAAARPDRPASRASTPSASASPINLAAAALPPSPAPSTRTANSRTDSCSPRRPTVATVNLILPPSPCSTRPATSPMPVSPMTFAAPWSSPDYGYYPTAYQYHPHSSVSHAKHPSPPVHAVATSTFLDDSLPANPHQYEWVYPGSSDPTPSPAASSLRRAVPAMPPTASRSRPSAARGRWPLPSPAGAFNSAGGTYWPALPRLVPTCLPSPPAESTKDRAGSADSACHASTPAPAVPVIAAASKSPVSPLDALTAVCVHERERVMSLGSRSASSRRADSHAAAVSARRPY
ncbi:Homeobox protein yox1 [Blastocladiella emersonii ATCC 22665]|nr:Homeobox protein yox1 [Blastocladiella emersonii ATCC 22665]